MRPFFILLPFFSARAWAEENSAPLPPNLYWEAFFSMIFILALLVFVAWLLRKLGQGKHFGAGVAILGGVALGPRERVVLLEVGEECLVVGIVPGQIRTLHRLPKSDLKNLTPSQTPRFADYLLQFSNRLKK